MAGAAALDPHVQEKWMDEANLCRKISANLHSHNQPLEVPSGCVALDSFELFFENAGLEHLQTDFLERRLDGIFLDVFLDLRWLGLD